MKTNVIRLVFCLMALLLCAGVEELMPKVFGLGCPLLLTLVLVLSHRGTVLSSALLAIAAGVFEDALSSLPLMTSVSAFLVLASLLRWSGLPWAVAVLSYPFYQVWLALWTGGLGGGVFGRLLVALPIGVLTLALAGAVIERAVRKAAIDERD